MLQLTRADVRTAPFPHAIKEGVLPDDLFAALKADYPSRALFADQHSQTGATGSRTGANTGFDIYRGDSEYDRLIERSPAWREFDRYVNSPAFVHKFLEVFGSDLEALGCEVAVDPEAYERSEIEPRDVLRSKPTMAERVRSLLPKGRRQGGTPRLFTRLDIEKSTKGYSKPPHCDRQNRLCSLIVYFTDMEAEGIEGGELNIYRHKADKAPTDHERHPRPENVEIVGTLKPKANLGVFFPCSNNSYHGVNAVTTPGRERDFLYINISASTHSCW